MAFKLISFDGGVHPIDGTNPYGFIKDDPGGTRVNQKSNGDLQVLMQRMMAAAGVVPNDLPDNTINGFQLFSSLMSITQSNWSSQLRAALNGDTFTFENNIWLNYLSSAGGATTITIDETGAFSGNEVYAFVFCGAGTILNFVPAGLEVMHYLTSLSSLTIIRPSLLYIRVKNTSTHMFTVEVYADDGAGNLYVPWTAFGALGAGWVAGTTAPSYTRNESEGYVSLGGAAVNPVSTTPASIIMTLAAGYRPLQTQIFGCLAKVSGVYGVLPISVDTLGQVAIVGAIPGVVDINIFFDVIQFPTR